MFGIILDLAEAFKTCIKFNTIVHLTAVVFQRKVQNGLRDYRKSRRMVLVLLDSLKEGCML